MELKEGMYVRFNNGNIQKINHVDERNNPLFDLNIDGMLHSTFDIKKASNNIIDLIEEGDYVNGFPIIEVPYMENGKIIYKLHCGNKLFICNENYYIKSIVTKEQFENVSYKVKK